MAKETKHNTSRGILLVALGAPEYGYMAANLAASIRHSDSEVNIHLVYAGKAISHFTAAHKALFSSMAECPAEYYTRGTRDEGRGINDPATDKQQQTTEYIKAKTHIYELTPYEETLFLDVDMYILPSVRMSQVLNALSASCSYTIENRGYADLSLPIEQIDPDYSTWVNIREVKNHYKTKGRFYHLHSEFIFFKKNAKNKKFFDKVREVYDTRPLKWREFDGTVPDEYAFDIASALLAHYPHQDNYIAIYWHGMDGHKDWNKDVVKNYIGFSLGGNYIPDWIDQKVNAYKQLYRQSLKLTHLFNVPPKKRWNSKRKQI